MLVIHSLLCDPTDCSLPVSSVHGISQARILEWVVIPLLQGIFLTQGSNLGLLHCKQILYHLSHQRSAPKMPWASCISWGPFCPGVPHPSPTQGPLWDSAQILSMDRDPTVMVA